MCHVECKNVALQLFASPAARFLSFFWAHQLSNPLIQEALKKIWKWTFIYELVARLISRTAVNDCGKLVIRHFLFVTSWGGHEINSTSWMLQNGFFQETAIIVFQLNIVEVCRRSRKETHMFHYINILIRMLHEFFLGIFCFSRCLQRLLAIVHWSVLKIIVLLWIISTHNRYLAQ